MQRLEATPNFYNLRDAAMCSPRSILWSQARKPHRSGGMGSSTTTPLSATRQASPSTDRAWMSER